MHNRHFSEEAVVLVTGAASGIGAAALPALYAQGVRKFVLLDRERRGLDDSLSESRADAQVLWRIHDVADESAWIETVAQVRSRFGRLDLLLANAGIADAGLITDMALDKWHRVLSVNLDGVFLTLKYGLPLIKEGQRGGACVVVSSASAIKAEPGVGAYGASKAAALQLARVAAKECAPDRIRVNAILPGGVDTPIWRSVPYFQQLARELGSDTAAIAAMGKAMPLGRYATAEEIATQIVFLLSEAAAPMTGASVVVDGGYTL